MYKDTVVDPGLSYTKATFMTNREKEFYPYLKEAAEKFGLEVSMKTRLGDIVTGADNEFSYLGKQERYKVQQKHIDFALYDPETLDIKLLVELDDTTHDQQRRVNRDVLVDNILEGTGHKILHVRDPIGLEEAIRQKLDGQSPEQNEWGADV